MLAVAQAAILDLTVAPKCLTVCFSVKIMQFMVPTMCQITTQAMDVSV
ncbi:protein of unknown function [Legionella hackeliae]|uniref:Uncharacterized protein n=1 Tax=Legionella hackeliae TaxID=449 RepID=A0A0A8UUR0_LEGHA|nr:protein of unknown function [Legionella hackeliae]